MGAIKKGWRDVTINEYFELKERLDEAADAPEYEKAVIRVAFVSGMEEDDVWNLSVTEFNRYQVESLWMDEFNIGESVKFKTVTIDGVAYSVDTNLQAFTVAQYIDFQTFYGKRKSDEKVLGNILACFLVPKGNTYGEGYDIKDVVDSINEHLDIMTANEIVFFFLRQYLVSMRAIANYFGWMMKRLSRRVKDTEKLERLERVWEEMKRTTLDGLRLSTTWEP